MKGDTARRPRAILFDWDNTLVETWPVIHQALNAAFAAFDKPAWSLEETRQRARRSLRDSFPDLFGDQWQAAADVFYENFDALHLEALNACPGAGDMLEVLHGIGIYLGVVSNKNGTYLRREVAHLCWDRYFGELIGALDAPRDKPAPEPLELALGKSGIAVGSEVWFVGDTEIDLECAINGGCVPILMRTDAPQPEEFGEFTPARHFVGCQALCNFVHEL